MSDLWAMAWGAGLQDGLNPCIFVACAAFILQGFWLKRSSLPITTSRVLFVLVYAAGFLVFNFGPAQAFTFKKEFILAAKVLYFILGAGAFICGILFLRDWFLLTYGSLVKDPHQDKGTQGRQKNVLGESVAILITVVVALLLSVMATLWPTNNYILVFGNLAILKGRWLMVTPLLLVYISCSLWPLWMVVGFLSVKKLSSSLLKIICAAIFFIASSSMIFIFK